jgi:hypothetical protein
MKAYIKNTEISQVNNLMLHLKLLNSKQRDGEKWIKISAKINEIETKKITKNQ